MEKNVALFCIRLYFGSNPKTDWYRLGLTPASTRRGLAMSGFMHSGFPAQVMQIVKQMAWGQVLKYK